MSKNHDQFDLSRLRLNPKEAEAMAEAHDCPMMKDAAALRSLCEQMMGDHQDAAPAPKG